VGFRIDTSTSANKRKDTHQQRCVYLFYPPSSEPLSQLFPNSRLAPVRPPPAPADRPQLNRTYAQSIPGLLLTLSRATRPTTRSLSHRVSPLAARQWHPLLNTSPAAPPVSSAPPTRRDPSRRGVRRRACRCALRFAFYVLLFGHADPRCASSPWSVSTVI
jgi:hypothetical protein